MDAGYAVRKLAYRHGHIEADTYGERRDSERTLVRELPAGVIETCPGFLRRENRLPGRK